MCGFLLVDLLILSRWQNYGRRRGKKGYGGKSHLLSVRKRLFHETENKCKSWLPLQDVEVSARVVRQQIRVENTVRFLVYALSFDVTLFESCT